jgi:DNA-directed RNA polymerase specialized sigma24 family protein
VLEAAYVKQVDTDTTAECEFAHKCCVAWAAWIYGAGKLNVGTYSDVMDLPLSELKGHIALSEDQLLKIDHSIAQLPERMRRLVFVHYVSSEDEPMTVRYKRLGCSRLDYRTRMTAALSALYARLMPAVEQWRRSVL